MKLIVINGQKFHYLTLRQGREGGIDIVGCRERDVILDHVADEAAARQWIAEKVDAKTAALVGVSHSWVYFDAIDAHNVARSAYEASAALFRRAETEFIRALEAKSEADFAFAAAHKTEFEAIYTAKELAFLGVSL